MTACEMLKMISFIKKKKEVKKKKLLKSTDASAPGWFKKSITLYWVKMKRRISSSYIAKTSKDFSKNPSCNAPEITERFNLARNKFPQAALYIRVYKGSITKS
jgi:hypothetical protein